MTGNNVLLDTNVVIDLFKGDKDVFAFVETQATVYLVPAVVGELYLGAYRSTNEQKKLTEINNFLLKCVVLNADKITAENYAAIKAALLKKGKPIPENDLWIAASAKQHELPLKTTDDHFKEIDGITLV